MERLTISRKPLIESVVAGGPLRTGANQVVAMLFAIAIVNSRIERFINRHGMSLMAFLEDHCRVPARYAVGDQRT